MAGGKGRADLSGSQLDELIGDDKRFPKYQSGMETIVRYRGQSSTQGERQFVSGA